MEPILLGVAARDRKVRGEFRILFFILYAYAKFYIHQKLAFDDDRLVARQVYQVSVNKKGNGTADLVYTCSPCHRFSIGSCQIRKFIVRLSTLVTR